MTKPDDKEVAPASPPETELAQETPDPPFTEEHVSFIGPLPPPALFGQYEKILPGSADRILRLAENEQRIREKKIGAFTSSIKWGITARLLASVIFSLASLSIGGVVLLKVGDPNTGIVFGGLSLAPLVLEGIKMLIQKETEE